MLYFVAGVHLLRLKTFDYRENEVKYDLFLDSQQ